MNRLVILTKNYGYNFTGATMATQKFVERWSRYFSQIVVYTLHKGDYFKSPNILVRTFSQMGLLFPAMRTAELKQRNTIYYSDDHFGFLLGMMGKRYFHTYHGNWPDAAKINLEYRLKSFYFLPLYYLTLKNAAYIINVSYYMKKFTDKINPKSIVIRNGMDFKITDNNTEKYRNTCLMVGNVDRRKYQYAVQLGSLLKEKDSPINIHVYGRIDDQQVAKELLATGHIKLMGLVRNIPYKAYPIFLNLSSIENLSISVCEALANNIPVICFDVGGLSEVVKNGCNGYVIQNKQVTEVYETIKNLLRKPLPVDSSILNSFNWDTSANQYLRLFQGECHG